MGKLKDPSRLWRESNLIPTTTEGKTIHAAIVNRKSIHSICHDVGGERYKYNQNRWWRDAGPEVKTTDDPMGWVNCKKCFRAADGWMRLIDLAPPGICAQAGHPDQFFAQLSREIAKAGEEEKRSLWLILADYFDEQGDLRGEFIRVIQEIGQKPDYEEHPMRRVQLINHAWRLDEQIWPVLPGLGRSQ